MNKKRFSIILALILTFTFSFGGLTYGATQEELQNEYNSVQSEKEEVTNDLARVEQEITDLQPKVDDITKEVNQAKEKINNIENQILKKKDEMQNREDGLNERLRVMYKNGSLGYIDVLLNSGSISELISNLEMMQLIFKNDINAINVLEKEQAELKKIEKQLRSEKEALDIKKAELDGELAKLNRSKAELEAIEDELLRQAQELASQMYNRIDPDSEYIGGSYIWPVPSSKAVTSVYGWRIHPIFNTWKFHSGIDIGASEGSNLLACASGTVILSQEYGGYGQCIIIDHGGGITTLYGHLSKRIVSVGDKVTGGQLIGYVGQTGWSKGPHLHLEFAVNGELVDPLAYVG